MVHKITYMIAPVPASRPRVTRWGTYYGKTYSKFRKQMEKLVSKGEQLMLPGALNFDVTFYIQIPKSYPNKKRRELHGKPCISRMDLDNLEKALYDSMTGHVYVDDKQIVAHSTRKIWSEDIPRIEVAIEPVD